MLNVLDEKHLFTHNIQRCQSDYASIRVVLAWSALYTLSLPDQLIPVTELWPGLPDITTIQRKMPKY